MNAPKPPDEPVSGEGPGALTRRGFLKAGGLAAAAGAGLGAAGLAQAALDKGKPPAAPAASMAKAARKAEPFFGEHQAGIATPQQTHTYFAAFDITTNDRADVIALLKTWTEASARLTQGDTAQPLDLNPAAVAQPAAPADDAVLGGMSTLDDAAPVAANNASGGRHAAVVTNAAVGAGAAGGDTVTASQAASAGNAAAGVDAASAAGADSAAGKVRAAAAIDSPASGTAGNDGYAPAAAPAYSAAPFEDSGEALGLDTARLTLTFGFGPSLFTRDGVDRFGLAARRPDALVDLPRFNGDQLVKDKSGGDLCVQACADDPQVAFHAVRQLARLAQGKAAIRWVQAGFLSMPADGGTPRNLMGFKDGTNNPPIRNAAAMDKLIWAGAEGPAWMRGGTYTVFRRIRITLEHWDNTEVGFQEAVFGRHKYSGAPLGKQKEFDPVDLAANDAHGNPTIPDNSHVRLSNQASNNGAQILRRSYSYNDGVNFYAERWPPWRQELEYDAGLLFVAHQRDPRTAFIPINHRLAASDLMNQFTTHVGSAVFACPPGAKPGSFIGAGLFEA